MKTTVIEQLHYGNISVKDIGDTVVVVQRGKPPVDIYKQIVPQLALAISPEIKDLLQGAADSIISGNQDRMNDAATDINDFLNQHK